MNESSQDWFDACSAPQIFDFDIQLDMEIQGGASYFLI